MKRAIIYNGAILNGYYQVCCNRCGESICPFCGEKADESSIDICHKCAVDMYKNELKVGK